MAHVLKYCRTSDPYLDALPLYRKVWALNVKTRGIKVPAAPPPKQTYSPAKFTATDMASVLAAQKSVVEQRLHEKHSQELTKAPGNTYDFTFASEVGTIKGQDNLVVKLDQMSAANPSYVQMNFPSSGSGDRFKPPRSMSLKEFREKSTASQKSLLSTAKHGDITFVQLEGSPKKKKATKEIGRISRK
jgi:hypothetical protein